MRTIGAVLLLLLALAWPAFAQTPPTGFTTVQGTGWTQGSGVATAPASFGTDRWSTAFGPDQQAACTISVLPTVTDAMGFAVDVRRVDLSNRIRAYLTRVTGSTNDTITLEERIAGVTTTLGSVNLTIDATAGDSLGVEANGTTVQVHYKSSQAPFSGAWKTVLERTVTLEPNSSYIGLGGASPTACTSFFGEGEAPIGSDDPPSTPGDCTVTVLSDTSLSVEAPASTDDHGISSYSEKRCSTAACTPTVEVRNTPELVFVHTGLTANTIYGFRRRAIDTAAQASSESNICYGTTLAAPDTTAPTQPGAVTVTQGARSAIPTPFAVVSVQIAAVSTDATAIIYELEMGAQSDCSDCVFICETTSYPVTVSGADGATCAAVVPYGSTRYFRTRARDTSTNRSTYTSAAGITLPASYHTAAPARPAAPNRPASVQEPPAVNEPPVP